MVTTITGKNQVTLPAALLRDLDWKPGTQLEWSITPDGKLLASRKPTRADLARQLLGRGRHLLQPTDAPLQTLLQERLTEEAAHAEKTRRLARE